VKVEPVDGVGGGVNRLSPKPVRSLVFIKHGSSSPLHYFVEVCREKRTHACCLRPQEILLFVSS
jgi:hypothetical protein